VVVELPVLGRDDRLGHVRRHVLERDVAAELVVELRDLRLVVGRVDPGDLRRVERLEFARQICERLAAGLGRKAGHGRGREDPGRHDNTRQRSANQQIRRIQEDIVIMSAHPGRHRTTIRD